MTTLRNIAFASALLLPSIAGAQPLSTDTQGYLDFRSATPSAPSATWATGPYVAGFSTVSLGAAGSALDFNVFCIDVLGGAGDSKVLVQTFAQAVGYAPLVTKFADDPEGTTGGLTETKLRQAAWLTTQMTTANIQQWDEMHVAMWGLFWDAGTNGLKPLTWDSDNGGSMPSAQSWFDRATGAEGTNFDASGFRVLTPVNDNNVFDASRQVFIAQVVPEPSTYALMGAGLLALGVVSRRRRRVA